VHSNVTLDFSRDGFASFQGAGSVTQFQQAVDFLSGAASMASLRAIQVLNLSNTVLSDISALTNFTSLRVLNIGACRGVSNIWPLASLTNLEELSLGGNRIANVTALSGLTKLRTLILDDNRQLASLQPLEELTNLTRLSLYDTAVADLSPLHAMPKLEYLSVERTPIVSLDPLSTLTNLLEFDLGYAPNISDLNPLRHCTRLRSYTSYSGPISDFTPLASLTNLEALFFLSLEEHMTWIFKLPHLKSLRAELLPGMAGQLTNVTSLTRLDIRMVEPSIAFLPCLTNLQDLTLYGATTDIDDWSALTNLVELRRLCILNAPKLDAGPLASLTNLTFIDISDAYLPDLAFLKRMTNVSLLSIQRCHVRDISTLTALADIPEGLQLNGNAISNIAAIVTLVKSHPLKPGTYMGVGDNPLTAQARDQVDRLKREFGLNIGP
jgi:internalin A